MELYEAIYKRKSVREFQERSIEADKLKRVLEAGLKAPTNNYLRQWEFTLIKDPDQREKVAQLFAKGKTITNEMELEKVLDNWSNTLQRESIAKRYLFKQKCWEVLQSCLLSAIDLGNHSKNVRLSTI